MPAHRFSNRTINETYREQRALGDDDLTARTRVNERLQAIYGEVPTEVELNEAARHYEATRVTEDNVGAVDAIAFLPAQKVAPSTNARRVAFSEEMGRPTPDVSCPDCGADAGQPCIDKATGQAQRPHRSRKVVAADLEGGYITRQDT